MRTQKSVPNLGVEVAALPGCRAAFVAKYGDISVELDALPPDVLRERLQEAVCARMDLGALKETQEIEKAEKVRIVEQLAVME